ncbi:AAA family ATPase [Actinoplanes sp. LDG1-06]|uniref:AAA family ATPase n=1 Tax=Paractinoplanes ovalisporus TaxID=2810368 RepID=A0ABS2AKJ8_9ACTN|nr:LuxR C-terminal-related transcriptional regulator [Actinoplanes ovalisporus]MBM2620315.1 AAA family ATPase [Actinoplanes ovalisporus]
MGDLVERADQLAALRSSDGFLVLVGGEAGSGKTALLREFGRNRPLVLWGACDPLFTPRPLGPFVDIARTTGGELGELVAAGAKAYLIAAALVRWAEANPGAVVVLEDLHWADEATLDVLSLLARRIGTVPALIVGSYRDDELDRFHPLRRLLGDPISVRRLAVPPLTTAAVATLAAPHGLDPDDLHRVTGGNAFFVTEVIAAACPATESEAPARPGAESEATARPGTDSKAAARPGAESETAARPGAESETAGGTIPATVRDAVLARAGRLDGGARTVLEAVSIALPRAELGLLDVLVPDAAAALEQCLSAGMLREAPGGVEFRHELARQAVEQSLPPHRRVALHRRALAALTGATDLAHHTGEAGDAGLAHNTAEARDADPAHHAHEAGNTGPAHHAGEARDADLARLAHHADAAGDVEAVLRFAPAAARQAASTGAHREAAAHYAHALRFGPRADLLESLSYECYLTDQMEASIDALEQAVALRRDSGDELRQGAALSMLSRELWCMGRTADSARAGAESLRLLEGQPPGPELGLAYSVVAAGHLNDERLADTLAWGEKALAHTHGDVAVTAHTLNTVGTMQFLAGRPEGFQSLSRSLALAEEAGLEDHVGRAYIHLGWAMTRTRAYDLEPWLDRGLRVCRELGLEAWEYYVVAYRARLRLDVGRFDAAVDDAEYVLRSARSVPLLRLLALSVLGLARARRGEPGRWEALDEALTLTAGQSELQYLAPVAAARAEAAWLDGRSGEVAEMTGDVLATAIERDSAWVAGELFWLRRLAGIREEAVAVVEPYGAQLAWENGAAAARWTKLGCPYDAALALAGSDDVPSLRRALDGFQRLGARPAAALTARRLREHGVRDIPRGPRTETERHPAHLTRREAEVLERLRRGESNAVIAARLSLSEKTVHHHVSAVLRKLGVTNRREAAATRWE